MDDDRDRIRRVVKEEFVGHAVLFNDDHDGGDLIRFVIEDSSGNIVTRGQPAFHRAELRKWSDDDLRALIRFVCGGKISK